MLLRHNVDVVSLDAERHFGRRSLGPAKGRRASYELWLSLILQDFFLSRRSGPKRIFLPATSRPPYWRSTARMTQMAAYVYDYLTGFMQPLWLAYRRASGLRRTVSGSAIGRASWRASTETSRTRSGGA